MLSKEKALSLAKDRIASFNIKSSSPIVVNDKMIIEENFGWVFFYDTLDSINGKSNGLVGNAPLIIEKKSGTIHETGTGWPMEYYINKFQKENGYSEEIRNLSLYYRERPKKKERGIFKFFSFLKRLFNFSN